MPHEIRLTLLVPDSLRARVDQFRLNRGTYPVPTVLDMLNNMAAIGGMTVRIGAMVGAAPAATAPDATPNATVMRRLDEIYQLALQLRHPSLGNAPNIEDVAAVLALDPVPAGEVPEEDEDERP